MFRISLVNMPFSALQLPSIALTQLKGMLDERFGDQVSTEILYLNQDFAHYIGIKLYQNTAESMESHHSGMGDWFFRQAAFPELPDNSKEYFQRYYPHHGEQSEAYKRTITEKRLSLNNFLNRLVTRHKLDQADVVGFTSMFAQNVGSCALARKIKERNPNVITAMGGANCESPMGQVIVKHVEQMDYVFSGPALISFPEFIQHCLDKEFEKCHEIRGVFSKKNTSLPNTNDVVQIGKTTLQTVIGDELNIDEDVPMNYAPFLATMKKNFPRSEIKPILLFETSRGCWWGERAHCTFCGLNGLTMKYRAMRADKALAQFDRLFKHADVCSRFEAVDNILPKHYLSEVLPSLNTPSNATLFYEVKADLSEEDVKTLAHARVNIIQPGIEALNTSTLKLMKKGTSAFTNVKLLKNCALYGVFPAWNLLIGFPREEAPVYEKYIKDIPLLTHLPPPTGSFPVRFDRFSPYYTQAKDYELDLHPFDFYQFIYPFNGSSLANLAYYFVDRNFGAAYMTAMLEWVGKIREKITIWQTRYYGQGLAPKLYFKETETGTVIYDSRSGQAVEYAISDVQRELLEILNKPKIVRDLTAIGVDNAEFDAEEEMAFFIEKQLVFQEGERYLNLVLPRDTQVLAPK